MFPPDAWNEKLPSIVSTYFVDREVILATLAKKKKKSTRQGLKLAANK